MLVNSIQVDWLRASKILGFEIISPFLLLLPENKTLNVDVLVPFFGTKKGTLIFSHMNQVKEYLDYIEQEGFNCSIITERGPKQEFDIDNFIEALSDWEWASDIKKKPQWIRKPLSYEPPEC